mmetsp:Transcript_21614/g.10079  ORF Transcript_21614/g.10079 Transcript_21614/m.10079 type:complete len:80 (-) Transcript_21614:1082-1321(-)
MTTKLPYGYYNVIELVCNGEGSEDLEEVDFIDVQINSTTNWDKTIDEFSKDPDESLKEYYYKFNILVLDLINTYIYSNG